MGSQCFGGLLTHRLVLTADGNEVTEVVVTPVVSDDLRVGEDGAGGGAEEAAGG